MGPGYGSIYRKGGQLRDVGKPMEFQEQRFWRGRREGEYTGCVEGRIFELAEPSAK